MTTADYILYAMGALIGFALFVFILRWILAIKRQLWNQQQQIKLLARIAEKMGVDKSEVDAIEEKNNSSF